MSQIHTSNTHFFKVETRDITSAIGVYVCKGLEGMIWRVAYKNIDLSWEQLGRKRKKRPGAVHTVCILKMLFFFLMPAHTV